MKPKQQDTYKEVRTIVKNNIIGRIYIPDLTEEERVRRRKEVAQAAAELLASIPKK